MIVSRHHELLKEHKDCQTEIEELHCLEIERRSKLSLPVVRTSSTSSSSSSSSPSPASQSSQSGDLNYNDEDKEPSSLPSSLAAPLLPVVPMLGSDSEETNSTIRREFEFTRHGQLCLVRQRGLYGHDPHERHALTRGPMQGLYSAINELNINISKSAAKLAIMDAQCQLLGTASLRQLSIVPILTNLVVIDVGGIPPPLIAVILAYDQSSCYQPHSLTIQHLLPAALHSF